MKKRSAWVLCILMALALIPAAIADGDYPVTGKCGDNAMWSLDANGVMTISGTGSTTDHMDTSFIPTFNEYLDQIKTIIFESGITRVGSDFISSMPNLKEIRFSETVESVGADNTSIHNAVVKIDPKNKSLKLIEGVLYSSDAFVATAEIEPEIHIPEGIKEIPVGAFFRVKQLKKVTLPGTVWYADHFSFSDSGVEGIYFRGLPLEEEMYWSEDFSRLPENFAFYYREDLKKAWEKDDVSYASIPKKSYKYGSYPAGTQFCGDDAYWTLSSDGTLRISGKGYLWRKMSSNQDFGWMEQRDKIKKIVIEEGITMINPDFFTTSYYENDGIVYNNLTSISLPASLRSLADSLSKCPNLLEFKVASGSKFFTAVDGILYSKDMKILYRVPPKNTSGTFWVPSTVRLIRFFAFADAAFENVMVPPDAGIDTAFSSSKVKNIWFFGKPGYMYDEYYMGFLDVPADIVLHYPSVYASDWAPNGETTYKNRSLVPFDSLPFTAAFDTRDVQYKGTTAYMVYTGSALKPRLRFTDEDGNVITQGYFKISYRSNTNPGTAYADVQLKIGGEKQTKSFKIYLPATETTTVGNVNDGIKVGWKTVPGAKGYVIYRRAWSSTTNGWTTFERWNNTTKTTWTDTKVYAGTRYQYGVKAYFADPMDNYNLGLVGPLKTTVRITTRTLNSVTAGIKQMTVKWTPSKNFTGIQIKYATDAGFTKNVKTVKVASATAASKLITGLTSGTTYYVTVRSYQVFNGMTYYGGWSNVLSAAIK